MKSLLDNFKVRLRRVAKASIAYTAYSSGMIDSIAALRTGIMGQRRIIILGYHRVVEDFRKSSSQTIPSLLISGRTLKLHLELVCKKFDCISIDDAVDAISGRRSLRQDAVVLTFDDGYRDFYEVAFPILRSYGLPATIYVPTSLIGSKIPLVHDQLYYLIVEMSCRKLSVVSLLEKLNLSDLIPGVSIALKSNTPNYFEAMRVLYEIPYKQVHILLDAMKAELGLTATDFPDEFQLLTWDMLREMAVAGITIGAHTQNHVLLTRESTEIAEKEIRGSKEDLEKMLGTRADHFAYPDGRYNAQIAELVKKAGFRSGSTIEDRPNTLSENLYQLKRKLLWEKACLGAFSNFSKIVAECQLRGLFANPIYKLQHSSR
jgi:peptidoglycan/xylan/chitin deacetylase (PgdA/CDA1 family)